MGIELQDKDISTAHRLPTYNKSVDDKIIVKFTRRSIRDEFYGKRTAIADKEVGKVGTLRDLSQDPKKKLFISESLTQARKKLFGGINKFKKDNKWKYIMTNKETGADARSRSTTQTSSLTLKVNFPLGK